MPRMSAPRPHTGGPRRTLDAGELNARLQQLLATPRTPERTQALRKVRAGLQSIANRSPRGGA